MSSKISVTHIIKSHYQTLFSSSSIKTKISDFFYIFHSAISYICPIYVGRFSGQ